jgi:hypothetical protein
MLAAGWPAVLAARLVVPYVVSIAPFRSLPDDRCELARGLGPVPVASTSLPASSFAQLLIWAALR